MQSRAAKPKINVFAAIIGAMHNFMLGQVIDWLALGRFMR